MNRDFDNDGFDRRVRTQTTKRHAIWQKRVRISAAGFRNPQLVFAHDELLHCCTHTLPPVKKIIYK